MTSTTLRLSDGRSVSYRACGGGAPLVLIHGVGLNAAAWAPQCTALAASRRVIAVDMPGHGGSDPLAPGAELPDFVAWCAQVIAALGVGPVDLAGHSMGALIAGGVAVTWPDLVTRVALLNGVYRRDPTARAAVVARAEALKDGVVDVQTPLVRWFDDSPAQQQVRREVAGWLRAVDQAGYATAYTAFAKGDATYAAGLAQVQCPLLALTGARDPNSTPAMARQMAGQAPRGRPVVIEGHKHMVNLTAPEAVNAALLDWLQMPLCDGENAARPLTLKEAR